MAKSQFETSVSSYSSRDVKNREKKRGGSFVLSLLFRALLIAISIAVFGYSIFMIVSRAIDSREQELLYSGIRAASSTVAKTQNMREPNSMLTLFDMLNAEGVYDDYVGEEYISDEDRRLNCYNNYKYFKNKYPETFAWVYVTNLGISYPVMRESDDKGYDYYLTHNYLGNETKLGSIFCLQNVNEDFAANWNVPIYGHCMNNGSMFGIIKLWYEGGNRDSWAKTMQIEIYTDNTLYVFDLFSIYREDGSNFARNSFADEADYYSYIRGIYNKSGLKLKRDFSAQSKLVTLITCSNSRTNPNERYALHGILAGIVNYG